MSTPTFYLGTLLRHLVETLDGAVQNAYAQAGLDYRPRYTPVVRTLVELGPSSIRTIAGRAGITHSAASQTVSQMTKQGLVRLEAGEDARERIVALTPAARRMLPALERCWAATRLAAQTLEDELSAPLSTVLREAIDALEKRSFAKRLDTATDSLKRA
jgi:DNA-binding MarR family transcriptional regulator